VCISPGSSFVARAPYPRRPEPRPAPQPPARRAAKCAPLQPSFLGRPLDHFQRPAASERDWLSAIVYVEDHSCIVSNRQLDRPHRTGTVAGIVSRGAVSPHLTWDPVSE
jgi:hypothetical protein